MLLSTLILAGVKVQEAVHLVLNFAVWTWWFGTELTQLLEGRISSRPYLTFNQGWLAQHQGNQNYL